MNIVRTLFSIRHKSVGKNVYRNIRFSASNNDSTHAAQPQVQEEKFDFEDLQTFERVERRKAKIPPFMKDVFVSVFNQDLLAYPEIMNKEETQDLDKRIQAIDQVFSDPKKTKDDRVAALKSVRLYAATVPLTNRGLAANLTETLRYLEVISTDFELGQELSDHWICLEALRVGLTDEHYNAVIDDLKNGDVPTSLCIKERLAERLKQADFRTKAEMDGQGVWRINGEKVCNRSNGYLLVLCITETSNLKLLLVHPGAAGVTQTDGFVSFMNTPATPLDQVTESRMTNTFAVSRLHASTLCRQRLKMAIHAVVEYIRLRVFAGKPLSELSTIRAILGEALLHVYASESADYFVAGLVDGYTDPDVEMEVAMCRNFMANHGLSQMLKLIAIPALEKEQECSQFFEQMRHLITRGESLDNLNMFIALNGIQHASQSMAQEIKKVRNPLMNPGFIFKKVFANRLQEKDEPKLTLHLSESLHPSLRLPSEQLEYCVLRMRYASETLLARHGLDVATAFTELNRLAQAGTEILAMTAVLARASRSYCIGLRNAEVEMKLAACFVEKTKDRVRKLIKEIDDGEYLNLDHFKIQFGKKVLETNSLIVEKPTARSFW